MKLNDTHIWALIIIAGFITGLVFNSLYNFLWLVTFAVLFIFIILIVFIIELFVKGNRFIRIAGFFFFFFFLASICSFAKMRLNHNSEIDGSEKVISKLNNFYSYNRQYPRDINTIGLSKVINQKFLKSLKYGVDPSCQSFTISFNIDGARTYTFHSNDRIWTYKGFEW